MGITKTELFTDAQNDLARIAKVFGHPARIAIIQHLLKVNACICGDIVEAIDLAQPTISQHLKELKSVGIIKGTVEGTSLCCCIDRDNWNAFRQLFEDFFNALPAGCEDDCC